MSNKSQIGGLAAMTMVSALSGAELAPAEGMPPAAATAREATGAAWVTSPADGDRSTAPPAWAADAVWYQVFVSRFRNGDPANDPPGVLPWADDWLADPAGDPPKRTDLIFRRYGGDLAGVREKLDYIRDLGANTLYLNPIFAAASEHKYDTSDLRHIDDTFGVAGALRRIGVETADPETWKWTESDRLFQEFLKAAHTRGIRVVVDGVFNHVGQEFWAWRDVLARGKESPYAGWFAVTDFGPPLHWKAWDGPNGRLVEFARTADGLTPEVERHIFAVVRRWMDPDGDGDPSDGVDGWRLDAPQHIPHGFWRRFHQVVKGINLQAIILGEIWFEDTRPWLSGDEFEVLTDYPLAHAVISFCRPGTTLTATKFATELEQLQGRHDPVRARAMISLLGSHDTDRVASMMMNARSRYDRDTAPGEGTPAYDGARPSDEAYARVRLAVVMQFTLPGAPMVYNGDELGMFGGDDPYCRAPMWWDEGIGGRREDLRRLHQGLARVRQDLPALRTGDFRIVFADDSRRLLAWGRRLGDERVVVLANGGTREATVRLVLGSPGERVRVLPVESLMRDFTHRVGEERALGAGGEADLRVAGRRATIVIFPPGQ